MTRNPAMSMTTGTLLPKQIMFLYRRDYTFFPKEIPAVFAGLQQILRHQLWILGPLARQARDIVPSLIPNWPQVSSSSLPRVTRRSRASINERGLFAGETQRETSDVRKIDRIHGHSFLFFVLPSNSKCVVRSSFNRSAWQRVADGLPAVAPFAACCIQQTRRFRGCHTVDRTEIPTEDIHHRCNIISLALWSRRRTFGTSRLP